MIATTYYALRTTHYVLHTTHYALRPQLAATLQGEVNHANNLFSKEVMDLSESDLSDLDLSDLCWPKLINHPIKVGDVLSPAAVKRLSMRVHHPESETQNGD